MPSLISRTAVEDIVLKWRGLGPDEAERNEVCRRVAETLAWFSFALLLAAVIPDIGVAISLIGGIAALFIFVFPGTYCSIYLSTKYHCLRTLIITSYFTSLQSYHM